MNNSNVLTDMIKSLRVSNNLSQYQVAELLKIPRATYSMIESGHRKPTNEILIPLSNILSFDLVTFSEKISSYKTLEHYLLVDRLLNLIETRNDIAIKDLLEDPIIINEFDYGEPLIIKQYCQILVAIDPLKDYNYAYQKCIEFLGINPDNIQAFQPKIGMPNQYYSQIFNLQYVFHCLEMYDEKLILCDLLVSFLESTFFCSEIPLINIDFFFKKIYIISLNNLADAYLSLGHFDKAFDTCNKAIHKSNKLNVLSKLPLLLNLQIEILCNSQDFSSAKKSMIRFQSFCEVTNEMTYFENSIKKFKTKYPKLFE